MHRTQLAKFGLALSFIGFSAQGTEALSYPVVDTHQTRCYNSQTNLKECPKTGAVFAGQDAQYLGHQPSYRVNTNSTVTDLVTNLTWTASLDLNQDGKVTAQDKLSYDEAIRYAKQAKIGGHDDWRLPTIKELYSLIYFDGTDPSGINGNTTVNLVPFMDHSVLPFASGDMSSGERLIDGQYLSSTKYVSTTMRGDETVFGVNFIDGRIKGYGMQLHGRSKTFYILLVRGNPAYGQNSFVDNKNGTITDQASGLMWQQVDSQKGMNWAAALDHCENLSFADHQDWRLPNVKELQSIVDYSRSPETTNSASLDPIFSVTAISNEAKQKDYPNYWSSTTHQSLRENRNGGAGAYVAFGRSMGNMRGNWMDVHGAGSQRSDPKQGDASKYPTGHGPQGDSIRIDNYVRCVREGAVYVETPEYQPRPTVAIKLSGSEAPTNRSNNMGGHQQNAPRQPPQEALDACLNKTTNSSCTITTPRGKLNGQCLQLQQSMACVPQGHR